MSLRREHSTCCFFLHLKIGVGLTAMYIFSYSFLCILGLFAGDVRFSSGGYSETSAQLPEIFGAAGLAFGLVGLLGIYDDKAPWVRLFLWYLWAKLGLAIFVLLLDLRALRLCSGWRDGRDVNSIVTNQAMDSASAHGLCGYARTAYILGWAVEFAVNAYLTWRTHTYVVELDIDPPLPISFGTDYDMEKLNWEKQHAPGYGASH